MGIPQKLDGLTNGKSYEKMDENRGSAHFRERTPPPGLSRFCLFHRNHTHALLLGETMETPENVDIDTYDEAKKTKDPNQLMWFRRFETAEFEMEEISE